MLSLRRLKYHARNLWVLKEEVYWNMDMVSIKVEIIIKKDWKVNKKELDFVMINYSANQENINSRIIKIITDEWIVNIWDTVTYEIIEKNKYIK